MVYDPKSKNDDDRTILEEEESIWIVNERTNKPQFSDKTGVNPQEEQQLKTNKMILAHWHTEINVTTVSKMRRQTWILYLWSVFSEMSNIAILNLNVLNQIRRL